VISLTLFSPIRDISQIYIDIDAYPIWWLPLSVLLGMVIHDTYFYWLHRTFHQKHVYRFIHKVHHQSINPSPWASYSFDLLEAFAESFILIILVLILPFHPIALIIFGLLSFAINVYGHLGYEIMPKRFRTSILFQIFATSVYHNMHHRKFHGNYGLYFRIWDRLLGTEHPDYIKAYDDIQNRRFGK
jgi:sterol desaturase/sphingolipid hydroxylase (fatty acid hydroxylase superfamily)